MKDRTTVSETEVMITLENGAQIRIHEHQTGLRISTAGFNHNIAIEPIQANSILVVAVKNGLRSHSLS